MEILRNMIFSLIFLLLSLDSIEGREPVLHRVGGGKYTWAPGYNYSDWSEHEIFYVGDWLYFGFDKHIYNVLEVNKTSYEKCIDVNFIKNITKGGRDVFNLTDVKPYYFLSGRSYCSKGMKLAVYVQPIPPPSPPVFHPATTVEVTSSSPTRICSRIILILVVFTTWLWFFVG